MQGRSRTAARRRETFLGGVLASGGRLVVVLGRIEASPGSAGIDLGRWLTLIDSHTALARVPPRSGINPLTREPIKYRAPASTAIILQTDGADLGSISRAMDGSPYLIVTSREESVEAVSRVAEDVAGALGGRFVRAAE